MHKGWLQQVGKWMRIGWLVLICMMTAPSLAAAGEVYSPQRGTPERGAVLNAIRPILEVRVGPPVEFVVSWLRIYKDWAFVAVEPQRPGGGAIDPISPHYRVSEFQDGLHTIALLKFSYGRWNIVDYAIGPTDVFWDGDPLYAQFPRAFTHP